MHKLCLAAKWGFPWGLSYSGHYRQANLITSENDIGIQIAFHSKYIVAVWNLQDVAVLRHNLNCVGRWGYAP